MNRYIPTLENVLLNSETESMDLYKKRIMAVELLASIQPLIFFQHEASHKLSIQNVLYFYASCGSIIWQRMAVSTNIILYYLLILLYVAPINFFVIVTASCLCPRKIAGSFFGPRSFD